MIFVVCKWTEYVVNELSRVKFGSLGAYKFIYIEKTRHCTTFYGDAGIRGAVRTSTPGLDLRNHKENNNNNNPE